MADRGLAPEAGAPSVQADSALVIDGVYKGYGSGPARVPVIENVSLLAQRGQFVAVIGPSGCGKTTLLRIVAGLLEVDRGTVSIFGESVQRASAAKHIGLVPQSPALLPWRTVLDNVRLPLQVNKKTVLFVTHSIAEAITLADVVVIMSARPGTIQRVLPVGLPRPRDDLVETTGEFHALERQVRLELRDSWRGVR